MLVLLGFLAEVQEGLASLFQAKIKTYTNASRFQCDTSNVYISVSIYAREAKMLLIGCM